MSFWRELGLLRSEDNKCFQKACLITRDKTHAEVRLPFRYSDISELQTTDTMSVMPMSYDKKVKSIFTYDFMKPFVTGARIEFPDRTTMTITSIENVIDKDKAERDGVGLIGYNITLG